MVSVSSVHLGRSSPLLCTPPLFAFLIALSTRITGDILLATRLLGAALFAALLVAIPLIFRRHIGLTGLAGFLAILLGTHPAVILMFLSAMSEPLFVFAGTSSLLALCVYVGRPRLLSLALACALAAAAMLTRYVGLAYVITGALTLLFIDRKGFWRQRVVRALSYSTLAIFPTLIFLTYWMQSPYARTVRGFGFPSSIVESVALFVTRAGQSLWSWKPLPTPEVVAAVLGSRAEILSLGVVIIGMLIVGIAMTLSSSKELSEGSDRQELKANTSILLKVFSLFVVVFMGIMFAAFAFSLPRPDIDARTLFPLLPALMIILLGGIGLILVARTPPRFPLWLVATALVLIAIGSAPASVDIVSGLHRTGLGYTAKAWQESGAMKFLRDLDPRADLISNSPEAVMLFTGRSAYPLLPPEDERLASVDSAVGITASHIDELICEGGGVLALFGESLDGVDTRIDPESTLEMLSCEPTALFQGEDGTIYRSEGASQ